MIRYFNGIVNWPKEEIKANDLKKRERLRMQRAFHTQVQYTEAAYEVKRGRKEIRSASISERWCPETKW